MRGSWEAWVLLSYVPLMEDECYMRCENDGFNFFMRLVNTYLEFGKSLFRTKSYWRNTCGFYPWNDIE